VPLLPATGADSIMVTLPIYMDSHATTRLDPRVLDAMLPYLGEHFGNASSRTHPFGWKAAEAVDAARHQVAELIGARSSEVVFTSGATESNNLAIKGVIAAHDARPCHLVTVVTEHHAVLDPCQRVEAEQGCAVTRLGVDSDGLIDPNELTAAITPHTALVSVMAANNEIGVRQPIAAIAEAARARGVPVHTDAAQAVGRVPIDVGALGVDLASVSAHKMHGPKGVGALYVRRSRRAKLVPIIDGGGHEYGLRSGTLNVPGIVGFGKAAALASVEMDATVRQIARLRDRLWEQLRSRLHGVQLNGSRTHRLPHNLNVSFAHVDGQALLTALDDVAVSSGSACASATDEPSYVVQALGATRERARASVRFGLSRETTEAEVDYVADKVARVVMRLRDLSPLADESTDAGCDPAVEEWLTGG
jgi:cysteine desulfurase|tara:strand:- start:12 stop:1271 length:1260 start_codon:yes stop_codon:yes gene_type:complete